MPVSEQKYKDQIIALQERVAELEQKLVTDESMLIFNRQGLVQYLGSIAEEVRWQHKHPDKRRNVVVRSLSVLFIDIDKFKNVNDTHGHQAGDEVLRQIAKLIKEDVRELDVVGRYGGEEIVVGLVGASCEHAMKKAEQTRQKIANHDFKIASGEALKISVSIGVAELVGSTLDSTIKRADDALYRAKQLGRNQVVLAEPEIATSESK